MPDDTTARDFLAAARRLCALESYVGVTRDLSETLDAFLIAHPTAEDAETEIGRAARSDRSGLPDDADWAISDEDAHSTACAAGVTTIAAYNTVNAAVRLGFVAPTEMAQLRASDPDEGDDDDDEGNEHARLMADALMGLP